MFCCISCANVCLALNASVRLRQAIDASPNDPSLYSQRAQTHIKLENYLEAAEDAGKAIELDPKTGRHHHRKG